MEPLGTIFADFFIGAIVIVITVIIVLYVYWLLSGIIKQFKWWSIIVIPGGIFSFYLAYLLGKLITGG